uniref:Isoform 3 of Splicing factor U2AF 26 kDa subunit n=1 Tax=Mus musculus TaxID=10090 RepID=Q8BGJ9-3
MAEYLASIFGTEKDKVNCSFYFKIGACRHGDRCSRLHNKPTFSQTIVLLNLYRNPQNTAQTADGSHCHVSDVEVQEHYDNFFEEVFTELQEKYGEIEEMNVCDNLGDHLVGNVYVKVTSKVPHRSPSPRKEPTSFPRPPAWSLLRRVPLLSTQGHRCSCPASLFKVPFTLQSQHPQASELHNIICSTQEPPPPVPPPIKVKKFVNQGLWFPSTPTPKKGCKPTTVSAEELGASLGSGSALVSRGCFNTCNLRLSILGAF